MGKSRKRKQPPKKSTTPKSQPKSAEAVKAPPVKTPPVKAEKRLKIKCCICLDSSRCRKMKILACKHKFHERCVNKWVVEGNPDCPLCRAPTDEGKRSPQPSTSGITREQLIRSESESQRFRHVITILVHPIVE